MRRENTHVSSQESGKETAAANEQIHLIVGRTKLSRYNPIWELPPLIIPLSLPPFPSLPRTPTIPRAIAVAVKIPVVGTPTLVGLSHPSLKCKFPVAEPDPTTPQ